MPDTRIPKDFCVTEKHRQWASDKFGQPYLPDAFISEFVEYWTDNGKRKSQWDKTFFTWITKAHWHDRNSIIVIKNISRYSHPFTQSVSTRIIP